MQEITLIVATELNDYIGLENKLLWHLPDDLKFFKEKTKDHVIIMGRKTFESLGLKTLPSRTNVVITRQEDYPLIYKDKIHVHESAQLVFFNSLDAAIENYKEEKEVFIIGGGILYQEALPLATKIYKTLVNTQIKGDTLFPTLPDSDWEMVSSQDHPQDEKHPYSFQFQTWKRIKP